MFDDEFRKTKDRLQSDPIQLARFAIDDELVDYEWEIVDRLIRADIDTKPHNDSPLVMFENEVIQGRYDVLGVLGKGGQGTTKLAFDLERNERVVLKELSFRRAENWKAIELFEREAQALEQLDHLNIPEYFDSFRDESGDTLRFFIVQEFVFGTDLAKLVQNYGALKPEVARLMMETTLATLSYLHTRQPPVVHRDIKPSNLLLGDDQHLYLIDFGAVQMNAINTVGGSTVVGTFGYMPMEQYMGRAQPASDLYALGVSMLNILTAKDPSDFTLKRNRLVFDEDAFEDVELAKILHDLLAPEIEDRIVKAEEVAERLGTKRTEIAPRKVVVNNADHDQEKIYMEPISSLAFLNAAPVKPPLPVITSFLPGHSPNALKLFGFVNVSTSQPGYSIERDLKRGSTFIHVQTAPTSVQLSVKRSLQFGVFARIAWVLPLALLPWSSLLSALLALVLLIFYLFPPSHSPTVIDISPVNTTIDAMEFSNELKFEVLQVTDTRWTIHAFLNSGDTVQINGMPTMPREWANYLSAYLNHCIACASRGAPFDVQSVF